MSTSERVIEVKRLYTTQNADKIARREDYAHLRPNELLVRTLFPTLQGEGPFAGAPCVFVRLAGCNLGDKKIFCQWCDTNFKLSEAEQLDFEQIFARVNTAWLDRINPHATKLLVLTGGEPGLQPNSVSFIRQAMNRGWHVQVETNGTQVSLPRGLDLAAHTRMVTLVVSPKAGPHGYGYLDTKLWAGPCKNNILKLVVDAEPTSPHHLDQRAASMIAHWHDLCGQKSVYLSPMAIYLKEYKGEISSAWEEGLVDKSRTRKNYNYAYEMCLKHGALLSIQQHLFAEAP